MRDILFLVLVIGSAAVAVPRPVFGILAFISLSLLDLHGWAWTFGKTLPFAQIVGIGTIVGLIFWSEPRSIPKQRETFLLLALWIFFGLTTGQADEPQRAFDQLVLVSKVLLMVFLSTILLNTEHRLLLLIRTITLSLGFHALKGGIFAIASGGSQTVLGPEGSWFAGPNGIGLVMAMNLPLLFYASAVEPIFWIQNLQRLMFLFSFPAIICTYSRGAWLGLAAGSLLILARSKRKLLVIPLVVLMGAVALPALLLRTPSRLNARYDSLVNYEEDGSAISRFWNWQFCASVAESNPILGAGFDFYSPQAYLRYFPEFAVKFPDKVWDCHSTWLVVLAEHGFTGFLLWISLLLSCLFGTSRFRRASVDTPLGNRLRVYALGLEGAWLAFAVSGSFVSYAYLDILYQLVAVVIIMKGLTYASANDRVSNLSTLNCGGQPA